MASGRFQETRGRWEPVVSPTITADKVVVPIEGSSPQNLETFLDSMKEYIDNQIDKVVNGCSVVLVGDGVTLSTSNVAYLKPAVIEVIEEDHHSIKTIVVTMGGENITSSVWDAENKSIIISKVLDDIEVTVTTISLVLTLDGLSLTNSSLVYGQSFTTGFIADKRKQLVPESVVVTMDSIDITEYVFNSENNQVVIPTVTGNVVITARAEVSIVNLWNMASSNLSVSTPGYTASSKIIDSDGTISFTRSTTSNSARIQISLSASELGLIDGNQYTVKVWVLDGKWTNNRDSQIYYNGIYNSVFGPGPVSITWEQQNSNDVKVGFLYPTDFPVGDPFSIRVMVAEGDSIDNYVPYSS